MPDDHPAAPYAEGFDQVALKKWLGDWGKALTPSKPLGRRLFHVSLTGLNLVPFAEVGFCFSSCERVGSILPVDLD